MALYSSIREKAVLQQIASVALAIEALETILIEQGVLRDNQLMEMIEKLAKQKAANAINPPPLERLTREAPILAPHKLSPDDYDPNHD